MKIYLDNNLGVEKVEQEELTQDTIGYNILKVYIPNAVLTPYDTFTCYYGALLQNGRKVGWFAMEARTSSDADYEENYTLYKATLEQCVVSVEGKVYIGCQVLLGNSGNAALIKKNTAVVQFNVRKSVAINNDILVLDPDQTNTDVLESYKNLLENALLTYATKAMLDALDDSKADKAGVYNKDEVDTITDKKQDNYLFNKKYVACGDSFTKGDVISSDKVYPYLIAQRNNMRFVNMAYNGSYCHYGEHGFTNPNNSYYYQNIPLDADIITIAYGLNETSTTIGTKDSSDNTTIWGAYNEVLGWITTNIPNAKVGIISNDAWMTYDLRNALQEIASYWGVEFLDLKEYGKPFMISGKYSQDGDTNPSVVSQRTIQYCVSSQNGHPNELGHKVRSYIVENFLRGAYGVNNSYARKEIDNKFDLKADKPISYNDLDDELQTRYLSIINAIKDNGSTTSISMNLTWEQGKISSSGVETEVTDRIRTNDIIKVENGYTLKLLSSSYQYAIGYYQKDGTFISGFDSWLTNEMVFEETKYIRVELKKSIYGVIIPSEGNTALSITYTVPVLLDLTKTYRKKFYYHNLIWEQGMINTNGSESVSTTRIRTSNTIFLKAGSVMGSKSTLRFAYGLYQENGTFISGFDSWITHPVVIENDCYIRLIASYSDGRNITADAGSDIYISSYIKDCSLDVVKERNIHFSFDDVVCWKDLIINENTYESIFEVNLLNKLRTLHNMFGVKFTLNCFNVDGNYDISNLPNKWINEFAENSSWLKFSFHAEDTNTSYSTDKVEEITASYNKFVNAIMNATATTDCIDRFTRLGFFTGTSNNVKAVRDCNCGVLGLTTADDNRNSYYLTTEQSTFMQNHSHYFDATNQLHFIHSVVRIENVSNTWGTLNSYNTALYGNINQNIEVFTHEQNFTDDVYYKMLAYCVWAVNNGYNFVFWNEIYK